MECAQHTKTPVRRRYERAREIERTEESGRAYTRLHLCRARASGPLRRGTESPRISKFKAKLASRPTHPARTRATREI